MKRETIITIIAILLGIFCLTGLTVAAEKETEELKLINKIITFGDYEIIVSRSRLFNNSFCYRIYNYNGNYPLYYKNNEKEGSHRNRYS